MKLYFITVLIVLFSIDGLAQNSKNPKIFGRVTDTSSGLPLAGAYITIDDARKGAVTDASGNYSLTNFPPGHHVIEVSFTGYSTEVIHINIEGTVEKNFSLSPSIIENQQVIVTGVSSATSIRKAPVPLHVIRKADLMQSASTNIIDALSKVPGVSQLSTGPGISKPIIRGLGYNRVVVVNDGVRQEGQQWGDEHGIEIDEMSVNRVEVLKGPASLMYGSDAIAGVIHMISHAPVAEGTLKGNVLYNYQTNNRLSGIHGSLAGNNKSINWNAYGSFKTAGDYKNSYDGRVLNSRFNERNFGGYFGINKGWGFSHLIFSRFNQNVGLIEGDRDEMTGKFVMYSGTPMERIAEKSDLNSRTPLIPKQEIHHTKIISDNSFQLNRSRLKVNVAFQQNLRGEYGNPMDSDEKEVGFRLNTTSYNLQWQLPQAKDWHVSIGASGMLQHNTNDGEEAIIPDYNISDVGTFIFAQRFHEKFTVSGGMRVDHRSINSKALMDDGGEKFTAFKRQFTNVAASAGISIEPQDHISIKLNVARGYRAPNMAELASNGAHEGTNRYEYGDNKLKSESSFQVDAGLDMDLDHISFGVSAFFNNLNNFIYYNKLSAVNGGDSLAEADGEFIEAFRFNQQNALLRGFEIEVDVHPHPFHWLHFENSFSYVRGTFDKNVGGTHNLPLIPAARWNSELRTDFNNSGKRIRNIYARVGMTHVLRQTKAFTAYNTETPTSGYTLVNAGLGFELFSKTKQILGLHISGNNLTDQSYIDHLSRLKYTDVNEVTGRRGVFNMGRNISLKVVVPI